MNEGAKETRTSGGRLITVFAAYVGCLGSLGGPAMAQTTTSTVPAEVAALFFGGARAPLPIPRLIEGIEIVGAARTADGVILARLSIGVGDLVNEEELEASRIRLLSTGYFRTVEFALRRGSRRGLVLLVVSVEERNTLRLEDVAFGFGERQVPFLALGLSESNFLGQGVALGVSGALGRARSAGELRFFVPGLGGTPLQISGSALWVEGRESIAPEIGFDDPSLDYQRVGGTLGFGFGVGPAQTVSLLYRLESITADRLPNLDPPVLRRAPSILGDDSFLSTVSARWERDTRNDGFLPTTGSRLAIAVEVGSSVIGSDYEFSKYTGEGQISVPVISGHAIAFSVFGGLIQGEAPFFHQFFRRDFANFSYEREGLPRAVHLNFSEDNDYDDLLLDVGVEYTIPVIESRQHWTERVVFYFGANFTASGSLEESQEDFGGRDSFDVFPLTADLGLKIETVFGRFVMSGAYVMDLAL